MKVALCVLLAPSFSPINRTIKLISTPRNTQGNAGKEKPFLSSPVLNVTQRSIANSICGDIWKNRMGPLVVKTILVFHAQEFSQVHRP